MLPPARDGRTTASGEMPLADSSLCSTGSEPSPPKLNTLASMITRKSWLIDTVTVPRHEQSGRQQAGADRGHQDQHRIGQERAEADIGQKCHRSPPVPV